MIIFIYPQLCRGNLIVSGVLFIVSAGPTKERITAFLCWVNLMVWRRQAVTGYEEAGRVLEQWSGVGVDRLATGK